MELKFRPSTVYLFFFKLGLFVIFLQSMLAWFFWDMMVPITVITFIVVVWFILIQRTQFQFKTVYIFPLFFLALIEWYVVANTTGNALIYAVMQMVIVGSVLWLKDRTKQELLSFFTNGFALILLISIVFWLLFLAGVSLPHVYVVRGDDAYTFDNYYFFLFNTDPHQNIFLPRFSSVFVEPGHLGMISSFLLYANRFNLKKIAVWIIFIASILSFSLAAYVLMLMAFLVLVFVNSRRPWLYLFLFFGVIFSVSIFFSNYNNGDNTVNKLILERLQYDNGDFKGDNRYGVGFDAFYDEFINTENFYTGIGAQSFDSMGFNASGYKTFLVEYGMMGTILVFFLYFFFTYAYRNLYAWGFFLLYAASFLQRPYALWDAELFIFLVALASTSKTVASLPDQQDESDENTE